MSDMKRVILHWTAGTGSASDVDKAHYHKIIEQDLTIIDGDKAVLDNITTRDGDYAAHTLCLNSRSIGVAMSGMLGAQEFPFDPGQHPLTERQLETASELVAALCRDHGIPVERETVLTHAEVEPTLGVRQAGKWDITRLPWRGDVRGAVPVGDLFRGMVLRFLGGDAPDPDTMPTIDRTSSGVAVRMLQRAIGVSEVDGLFGPRTEEQVEIFQREHRLIIDGIAGPEVWGALSDKGYLG